MVTPTNPPCSTMKRISSSDLLRGWAFRACSGSGGSGAARRSRSSTYPQALLVNLSRRAIAEALVLALLIVEAKPGANAGLGLGDRRIGVEVDFLVFEAAPQSLDEDVVHD